MDLRDEVFTSSYFSTSSCVSSSLFGGLARKTNTSWGQLTPNHRRQQHQHHFIQLSAPTRSTRGVSSEHGNGERPKAYAAEGAGGGCCKGQSVGLARPGEVSRDLCVAFLALRRSNGS